MYHSIRQFISDTVVCS